MRRIGYTVDTQRGRNEERRGQRARSTVLECDMDIYHMPGTAVREHGLCTIHKGLRSLFYHASQLHDILEPK